jgi:hypothetical protein
MADPIDAVPRRYHIDHKNTTLIVEYKTNTGKRFMRKIRFKRYKPGVSASRVTSKLMRQFEDVLGPDKVDEEQVLGLVEVLLSKDPPEKSQVEATAPCAGKENRKTKAANDDEPFGDLNKASEEENQKAKELMNKGFQEKALRPGDEGYVYDKQVDFGEASEENDWDMESIDDDF